MNCNKIVWQHNYCSGIPGYIKNEFVSSLHENYHDGIHYCYVLVTINCDCDSCLSPSTKSYVVYFIQFVVKYL